MELVKTARFFGINYPADHIFSVTYLAVKISVLGKHLPVYDVDKLAVNCCSPYIHCNGIIPVGRISRLYIDNMRLPSFMNGPGQSYGDFKTVFSQNVGNLSDYGKFDDKAVLVIFCFQITDHARHVRKVVLGGRLRKLKISLFNGRHEKASLFKFIKVHLPDVRRAPGTGRHIKHACIYGGFNRNPH